MQNVSFMKTDGFFYFGKCQLYVTLSVDKEIQTNNKFKSFNDYLVLSKQCSLLLHLLVELEARLKPKDHFNSWTASVE